ncbi:MAG: hypothetical protein HGA25_08410 [Clostridiales bacterium]|nr:hypothetical protein [Clostridiales bacterium]
MVLYIGLAILVVILGYFVNNTVTVQPNMVTRAQMSNYVLVAAIFLLASGRAIRYDVIPYAPYLVLGAWMVLLIV